MSGGALEADAECGGLLVVVAADAGETPHMTSDRAWAYARALRDRRQQPQPQPQDDPADERLMARCRMDVWAAHCGCLYGGGPR
jgi:hypothetical protein